MLMDKRVLSLLGASMLLHFCWNLPMVGPFLIKFWLLGLIAWILVFALIQKGLRQLKAARDVTHTMTRGLSLAEVQAALKDRVNQINRGNP
jgi:RsiW-degrading membrane proteinase PrsW (M82 family)